jgi:ribonuclease P protein component
MISDGKLPKREHVLKSKDFRAIYKKGRSFKRGGFVLCIMPNGLAHSRIGFSISSTIVKLASIRNRIRRVFREIYRKNRQSIKTGFDIVVVVRKSPGKAFLYGKAMEIFTGLLKEAGVSE